MMLEAGGIKFLDSLNFLPMPLAAMSAAFGLKEEKGHWPFLFNCKSNYDYNGTTPDIAFYSPSTMKPEACKRFHQWYAQQVGKPFNFKRELIRYCKQDVLVLKQAVYKFREMLMNEFGVDPFKTSISIASLCMHLYRKKYMPTSDSIAIIPFLGYRKDERQSIIALKWLKWVAQTTGHRIQHKLNTGEMHVGQYKVDGMCGNRVYEMHGCMYVLFVLYFSTARCRYHGCPRCYPNRSERLPVTNRTADELYQRTLDRHRYIESHGYEITTMWECELAEMMKTDLPMKHFFEQCDIVDPIDSRDAFFGGRTNATKLYHKCTGAERCYYVDFCSLCKFFCIYPYAAFVDPYVCKYGDFPLGHATVYTENFRPIEQYKGLVKATVCPPTHLYHPILPMKVDHKLMFPLCSTCARQQQQTPCRHTDKQRMMCGTWASCELMKVRLFCVAHVIL
jgi:hypothetical protein